MHTYTHEQIVFFPVHFCLKFGLLDNRFAEKEMKSLQQLVPSFFLNEALFIMCCKYILQKVLSKKTKENMQNYYIITLVVPFHPSYVYCSLV